MVERRFLKLIDLIELLRLKFEILDVCASQETPDLLQECFNLAELVASQIDLVAESGVLLYLQDTSATRLSSYGSILHKVSAHSGIPADRKLFFRLSMTQQRAVVQLLRRVYQRCIESSKGDETAATAFVARFLRRCIRNLSLESAAPSTAQSPLPMGQTMTEANGAEGDNVNAVQFDIVRGRIMSQAQPDNAASVSTRSTGAEQSYRDAGHAVLVSHTAVSGFS